MSNVLGIGNCQVLGMARSASAALGLPHVYLHPKKVAADPGILIEAIARADIIFVRPTRVDEVREVARSVGRDPLVVAAPGLHFSGFHPDAIVPSKAIDKFHLPMGGHNSAILLAAWRDGLAPDEARTLFRDEVYDELGYYDAFALSTQALADQCRSAGLEVEPLMAKWMAQAPFFHLPVHPKIEVLRDVALAQLRTAGMHDIADPEAIVDDDLARNMIWPVYPEIAERLGFKGDYIFKPRGVHAEGEISIKSWKYSRVGPMDLEQFIERTYQGYRETPPDLSGFARMEDPRFEGIGRFVKRGSPPRQSNPYKDFPASNWWSQAVAGLPSEEVDPVSGAKFRIDTSDRIATAGSCFAQHIAKRLATAGFNYLVTEPAPPGTPDPQAEDYGRFSARFGNIYTARQLLQLWRRSYGRFEPAIDAWELPDGSFVDPFRPRIGGKPFSSLEALRADRKLHLAAVRRMFEKADLFVFTLGLTECWISRHDHAVVPLPPGAVGAKVPADAYEPKNFTVAEVIADLQALLGKLELTNPKLRIVLTVSPVPLVATFEDEHVLAATTYSKSVLRAAAGEIAKNNANVAYFPSYEIITGSYSRGRYFAEDLRQVTPSGVDHVMRSFLKNYAGALAQSAPAVSDRQRFESEAAAAMEIVCDEEELANSVQLPTGQQ